MRALHSELISQIDMLESRRTKAFPWKGLMDTIISEIEALNASSESCAENSASPLIRTLLQQNDALIDLVLLSVIAGQGK